MTSFQTVKATFYTLLAKAREPIQEREFVPAPTGVRHQPTGTTRPVAALRTLLEQSHF